IFDPQSFSQLLAGNGWMNPEEQQPPPGGAPTPPMPPASQPPTGTPAPQAADEFRSPRRPLTFSALTGLGTGVITGDPHDIEELLKLIEYLQKGAAGTQPVIELVPLKFADATSATTILSQASQRIIFTPCGAAPIEAGPEPAQ